MTLNSRWAGFFLAWIDLFWGLAVHKRDSALFLFFHLAGLLVNGLVVLWVLNVPKQHFKNRLVWQQAGINTLLLVLELTMYQYIPPHLGVLFTTGGSFFLLALWDWLCQLFSRDGLPKISVIGIALAALGLGFFTDWSGLNVQGVGAGLLALCTVLILPLFSIHLSRPIMRLADLAAGPPSSFAHTPLG